jgi:hypothetical protein
MKLIHWAATAARVLRHALNRARNNGEHFGETNPRADCSPDEAKRNLGPALPFTPHFASLHAGYALPSTG